MNLVVCIKQVPDTETQIKVGADGKSINIDDIKWVMNPYDEFGVEEALKIKEANGGEVTVVGAGPNRVTEALRTALAMGADKAILIEDEELYGADPVFVGKLLAKAVEPLNPDIVFFGQRAVDDDCGLASSATAEALGLPQLSLVIKQEIDGDTIKVQRPIEGQTNVLSAKLPVCITAQKGLNEPRYASLPGIMKAKKKPIEQKTPADYGIDVAPRLSTLKVEEPAKREAGIKVETVGDLVTKLRDEAGVI